MKDPRDEMITAPCPRCGELIEGLEPEDINPETEQALDECNMCCETIARGYEYSRECPDCGEICDLQFEPAVRCHSCGGIVSEDDEEEL